MPISCVRSDRNGGYTVVDAVFTRPFDRRASALRIPRSVPAVWVSWTAARVRPHRHTAGRIYSLRVRRVRSQGNSFAVSTDRAALRTHRLLAIDVVSLRRSKLTRVAVVAARGASIRATSGRPARSRLGSRGFDAMFLDMWNAAAPTPVARLSFRGLVHRCPRWGVSEPRPRPPKRAVPRASRANDYPGSLRLISTNANSSLAPLMVRLAAIETSNAGCGCLWGGRQHQQSITP